MTGAGDERDQTKRAGEEFAEVKLLPATFFSRFWPTEAAAMV
jgi:hypothetical protein